MEKFNNKEFEKKKRKVLLTSGISAFAQRIAKEFQGRQYYFADSQAIPMPLLKSGKYIQIPSPEQPTFVHEVLKACLDLDIEQLLPLKETELLPLAKNRLLFEEYGIVVLIPEERSLDGFPRLINPTRENSQNLVLKEPSSEIVDREYGVFELDADGKPYLCCVQN